MRKLWALRLWNDSGIGMRLQPPGVFELGFVASSDRENGLGATLYLVKLALDFGSFWYDRPSTSDTPTPGTQEEK